MQPTSLGQLLAHSGFNISASIEYMAGTLGYTDQEMEEVLQRDNPGMSAADIQEAISLTQEARAAANILQEGGEISLDQIPISPDICADSPDPSRCQFVVTAHVCIIGPGGVEQWQTVQIQANVQLTGLDIDNDIRAMVRQGRFDSLPGGAGTPGTVIGNLCGYDIVSIFRSS
jgi:hypothetical protein